MFLTELSLFESSESLFDRELFDDICSLVIKSGDLSNQVAENIKLSKLKETKILQNKYASKLDIEEFLT